MAACCVGAGYSVGKRLLLVDYRPSPSKLRCCVTGVENCSHVTDWKL